MKLSIIIFFLSICATLNYKSVSIITDENSIKIDNKLTNGKRITWQIFDTYGDTEPPYEFTKNTTLTIKTKYPVKALTVDMLKTSDLSFTEFLLYPNEQLVAYKDIQGVTRLKSSNDSIRTNELNFVVDLKQKIGETAGYKSIFPFTLSVNEQIRLATEREAKALGFLNQYTKQKKVSQRFKTVTTAHFKYDKIYYMLSGYFSPFVLDKFIKKFPSNLIYEYDKLLKELNYDDYIYLDNYRLSALTYVYYLCYKMGKKNSVLNLYEAANQNFTGRAKDYLLFNIIKTEMKKNAQNKDLIQLLSSFYTDCNNKDFVDYIKTNAAALSNNKISDNSFLSANLLKNDTLTTLGELVKHNKGKIIYIDFWASWCAPCLEEMPNSHQLQRSYKDIVFVYLSLDKNRMAWEKAIPRTQIDATKDSYLLINGYTSPLSTQFKISSIPRYMIIGKDGKVINANAPRPSDPDIRQVFDELLKQ